MTRRKPTTETRRRLLSSSSSPPPAAPGRPASPSTNSLCALCLCVSLSPPAGGCLVLSQKKISSATWRKWQTKIPPPSCSTDRLLPGRAVGRRGRGRQRGGGGGTPGHLRPLTSGPPRHHQHHHHHLHLPLLVFVFLVCQLCERSVAPPPSPLPHPLIRLDDQRGC